MTSRYLQQGKAGTSGAGRDLMMRSRKTCKTNLKAQWSGEFRAFVWQVYECVPDNLASASDSATVRSDCVTRTRLAIEDVGKMGQKETMQPNKQCHTAL